MTTEDHDLLIGLKTTYETQTKTICDSIHDLKSDIKEIKNNTISFQREVDKRPKWGNLITIFICLIGLVAGVIGYNFDQDVKAGEKVDKINQTVIKHDTILNKIIKK